MSATQDFADEREPGAAGARDRDAVVRARVVRAAGTSPRQKQMFVTQMTPWVPGHPSIPFDVILEDTSDTGAGVIGERPCKIGLRHLLMVPRVTGEKPVIREYTVVRCDLRPDGKYASGCN